VTAKLAQLLAIAGAAALSASCGDLVRQGRAPVMLVVESLEVDNGNTLLSDVANTTKDPCSLSTPCVFNDMATASLRIQLKDQGSLNVVASPSLTNEVTITRYRVDYRRTDGRATPGVDVPYGFDSAVTVTVNEDTTGISFQIVRHSAKEEAPLRALLLNRDIISTIATVTFYGHDQAGNDVSGSGNIGIDFGDFADEN
jgi:hypothetical protein